MKPHHEPTSYNNMGSMFILFQTKIRKSSCFVFFYLYSLRPHSPKHFKMSCIFREILILPTIDSAT